MKTVASFIFSERALSFFCVPSCSFPRNCKTHRENFGSSVLAAVCCRKLLAGHSVSHASAFRIEFDRSKPETVFLVKSAGRSLRALVTANLAEINEVLTLVVEGLGYGCHALCLNAIKSRRLTSTNLS